jgi:hypothetical protein
VQDTRHPLRSKGLCKAYKTVGIAVGIEVTIPTMRPWGEPHAVHHETLVKKGVLRFADQPMKPLPRSAREHFAQQHMLMLLYLDQQAHYQIILMLTLMLFVLRCCLIASASCLRRHCGPRKCHCDE